jgi:RND family efflux transporter MFP subunit
VDKQQISDAVDRPETSHLEDQALQRKGLVTRPFADKQLLAHTTLPPQVQHDQRERLIRPPRGLERIPTNLKIMAALMALLLLASIAALVIWYRHLPVPCVVYRLQNQQQVKQDIGGGGLIFPHQQFELSYPATGRVQTLLVKAGDQVVPNQPLLKLDPSQIDAAVNQAASAVSIAQNYLDSISASGNQVQIAQAQQSLQMAQDRYNALVAQNSSSTFHDGLMLSPLKGIVANVNVSAGETFTAGTVLLTIVDMSSVVVHARIPLANLSQVHVGLAALVTPSALPGVNVNGVVTAILPQADPQTDTFEADVTVTQPQQQILSGMSAFVRIQVPVEAYVVPRLAVLNPDREAVVFVVHNKHAYLQYVQIVGRSVNDLYIAAGLTSGSEVVINPLYRLSNGQAVTVKQVVHE